MALNLPAESRQSLEIVTHSLGELVPVYRKFGPTTHTFVEVMRKRKETVMGPEMEGCKTKSYKRNGEVNV